jgi:hypothetical protein
MLFKTENSAYEIDLTQGRIRRLRALQTLLHVRVPNVMEIG